MSLRARAVPVEWDDEEPIPFAVTNKYYWLKVVFEFAPADVYCRAICFAIAHHADRAGKSWPSVELLQRETGAARSVVIDRLGKMVDGGWLIRSKHRYKGAMWRFNRYQLSVPLSLLSAYESHAGEKNGGAIAPIDVPAAPPVDLEKFRQLDRGGKQLAWNSFTLEQREFVISSSQKPERAS